MPENDEPILLPRLGAHLSAWGSGHTCESDAPHDGPCVCECGVPQPYNGLADMYREAARD